MKVPFWATILTLSGVFILCGLGTWQIQRLHWKTGLIAAIAREDARDPMMFELNAEHLAAVPSDQIFIRGFAEGLYRHQDEIRIMPRTYKGEIGAHIITPFELLDNHILLVNRGWVPAGQNSDYIKPEEPLILTGTAYKPEKPNRFVPENDPAQNQWYCLDPEEIAAAKNLEAVLPYVLYAEEGYRMPVSAATKWELPNNHRGYAIFWFTMALVLPVIYYLRFIRKKL